MIGQPEWQYKQISTDLIKQIDSGKLAVGTKLPSEQQLGELYSVSRITIRKALADLEEKKYIKKQQGRGSFVLDPQSAETGIDYVEMPGRQLARHGYHVRIDLDRFSILANGEEPTIRQQMGMANSDYLYVLRQTYYLSGAAVIWKTTYMNFGDFPMITAAEVSNKEIIPMLEKRFGMKVPRMEHSLVSGIKADPRKILGVPRTAPDGSFVEVHTKYRNDSGSVSYMSKTYAPSKARMFLIGLNVHKEEDTMSEPHILLTRIDNRLVHGQVGVTWTKTLGANLLLVANDEVANDPLEQKLMKSTAESSGAGIRFFTLEKTIQIISKAADRQKIFIVVKTPGDVLKLVEGGVPIKEVNVGNMHFAPGKVEVTKKVYVDQQDKDDLMGLVNKGVNVYIQDVPGDRKTQVNF